METNIKSRTLLDLIKEAVEYGTTTVRVVFKPAFEEDLHGGLKNEALVAELKKNKISDFNVVTESGDVLYLLNNPKYENVVTINFVYLTKCNMCDSILIDRNSKQNVVKMPLNVGGLSIIKVEDGDEMIWGCPNCLTDDYLMDI